MSQRIFCDPSKSFKMFFRHPQRRPEYEILQCSGMCSLLISIPTLPRYEMRWIYLSKTKQVVYILVCLDSDQRIPRMVFHIWFTAGFYSNFSALCAGRSTGNSFSSSWDIGSQHWNGLSRRDIRWAFGMAAWLFSHTRYVMTCHEEFRLHIGYETPDEEATLLKLTGMEWSKVQDSGWSIHKAGFWKSLKWSPQFEALGVPNFAVAHLASFASRERGFFMICFRFLNAVDSCDIRLEASLDTFRIFWTLLLFVGGGCALLVGANCQALLPQNNLHWSSILVSEKSVHCNCFPPTFFCITNTHYIYICHTVYIYIHRIYCSIISQWKRLHHRRFLPMWPAAIRGRKSRDLVASEPDAWLWPFCRQRFTECCGSNIPPMLNHRAAKLDMRGVRRKSLYFVSGFNINIH